jgi:hypothetical protein
VIGPGGGGLPSKDDPIFESFASPEIDGPADLELVDFFD